MTKITLAVDPGLRDCGWALFRDKEMLRAGLARSPEKSERGPLAWRAMCAALVEHVTKHVAIEDVNCLVVEGQQVYSTKFQKGNQDDLLQLAGVSGAIVWAFKHVSDAWLYLPSAWKKQVPQAIYANRVLKSLTVAELATLDDCPTSLRHNIMHAIGLGRFHLGIKRGGQ